jgi:thiamine-phosphate pyrophosphorylase
MVQAARVASRPDNPVRPPTSIPPDRPLLCLITDRRRLSEAAVPALSTMVEWARAAAGAGIHLFQIREKDLEGRELEFLVRDVVSATAATRMRILVNDRIDVAIAAGAHGVHLPAASVASVRVRSMTPPDFIVGRSVHSAEEASIESAGGAADYLIIGTVFPSSSKPDVTSPLGIDELARASRVSRVPVLAIGGINEMRLSAVARSGAAGVAAITFFVPRNGEKSLQSAVELAQRTFDRAGADI